MSPHIFTSLDFDRTLPPVQESSRLSELLEAREAKMVDMSRQIVSLTEENQKLQEELAVVRETGQSDVEDMRAEFTRRIGASDKKLQAVTKVRLTAVGVEGTECFVE